MRNGRGYKGAVGRKVRFVRARPSTDGAAMLRYTARNGTSFKYDPATSACVDVTPADEHGQPIPLNLDDLREFLQHLDDQAELLADLETDADIAGVGAD
jgi:hypothetical protein